MYASSVTLESIRKLVIIAMFSDDWLMSRIVLKGGNALALIHGVGFRSSLDIDFSISSDFPDLAVAHERMASALEKTFAMEGLKPFDVKLEARPSVVREGRERWGGYALTFKLMAEAEYDLRAGSNNRGKYALVVGPEQMRTFTVDFSKHEFCEAKVRAELEDYVIYVYTPQMIAVEKVRALCQQLPEYPLTLTRKPRARDFYDVDAIATAFEIDFASDEIVQLVRAIFKAKDVPISLVRLLSREREFHRPDWAAVEGSVSSGLRSYDYYFDRTMSLIHPLHSLRDE